MKAIGETQAGAVIVEMTPEEWSLVNSVPDFVIVRSGNPKKTVPSEVVADEFRAYLDRLPLRGRVRYCLYRALGYRNESHNNHFFNMPVFSLGNEYISPKDWARTVAYTRRLDASLLSLNNFGKGSLYELKAALRSLLKEQA